MRYARFQEQLIKLHIPQNHWVFYNPMIDEYVYDYKMFLCNKKTETVN